MPGGAALALHAAGHLASPRDFKVENAGTVSPNPETAERYREKFRRSLDCYAGRGSTS